MLGPSFAGFNWFDFHIRWIQHVVAFFAFFKGSFCCYLLCCWAGRGSMHPHILIGLLGHDITDRLLSILDAGAQGDVNIELDRWSRAVKQAAERIRYDSQLEVARQLGVDSEPLPFNESQRSACGKHYEDIPVGQVEPDGHEIRWRESGGSQEMKLTGSYASLRPRYQRRSSDLSFVDFKKMLVADYRRLMIQNHFHKCTKSCFKGSLKRKKTGCRRGLFMKSCVDIVFYSLRGYFSTFVLQCFCK